MLTGLAALSMILVLLILSPACGARHGGTRRGAGRCGAAPGGSVIISAPNENSQKASKSVNVLAAGSQDRIMIIMIRTGSQMENKQHENVSKKVGRPKEHTG